MEEAGKRESLLHQGLSLCPPGCVHCVTICLFGQCKILGCLLIQRRVNIIWTNSSVAEKFWQALILRFLSSGFPKHGYSVRLFTGDHFGTTILTQEYLEYFRRDTHCSWRHFCFSVFKSESFYMIFLWTHVRSLSGGWGGGGGNSGNVRKNAFVSSGKCPYKITPV